MCAVPERGELGETDRLEVDVALSVEASAYALQLDALDLTQRPGVGQHHLVHSRTGVTAGHTHTHILYL